MGFIIKWRFILKLVAILTVSGVAIHFLHRWQIGRQVGVYLHQADLAHAAFLQAQEEGQSKLAAAEREREKSYLARYLMSRPNEIDVRERYARLNCESVTGNKQLVEAFFVLEDVLRRDPSRGDLRRYDIDFAMDRRVQLYNEARANLEILIKERPQDWELKGLLGLCLTGTKEYALAEKQYEEGIKQFEETAQFQLTDAALTALRNEPVPDTILTKLQALKNQELSRSEFVSKIRASKVFASEDEQAEYLHLILRHAKRVLAPANSAAKLPDPTKLYAGEAYILRIFLNNPRDPAPKTTGTKLQPTRADRLIERMVDENFQDFRAHIIAANYWREFGAPELAEVRMETALQLAPNDLDVLLVASEIERARGRRLGRERNWRRSGLALAKSLRLLTHALNEHPKAAAAYLAMAAYQAEGDKVSDALDTIKKGLEAVPKAPALLLGQMEYQFRAGETEAAAETLKKLSEQGLPPDVFDYENARVMVLKEQWLEARKALDATIPKLRDNPNLFRQANLLLGRCCEQLGENEARLKAFTDAMPLTTTDPLWVPAMLGVAEAQVAVANTAGALETFRKLKDLRPGGWIPVARLEMNQALQSIEENRDWKKTEEAIAMAEKGVAENLIADLIEIKLLRIRLIRYTRSMEEARKRLEELRVQQPKEITVWLELARMEGNNYPQALAILAAGEKEAGDSPELRLARADLWAKSKEPELAAKINELATYHRENFNPSQQRRLLRGLAEIAGSHECNALATQLWNELGRIRPFDLGVQLIRFDWASQNKNQEAMQEAVQAIENIDGVNGQWARLIRSTFLMLEAQRKNEPALRNEALALLNGLEGEVLGSRMAGKVALGQAIIHDFNGNVDEALKKYQSAIDKGESDAQALRRYMAILAAKKRFPEAQAIFGRLPRTNMDTTTKRLGAELALQTGDVKKAQLAAEEVVPATSQDYQDLIWLGRLYWSLADRAKSGGEGGSATPESAELFQKAAATFRRATETELGKVASDTWLVRMQFLIEAGKKDEAEKVFKDGLANVKTEKTIFRALAYSQLGQTEDAIKAYEQARTEKGNDARILLAEAEYLFRLGKLTEARAGYKRVMDSPTASPSEKAFARQRNTLSIAADPDYTVSRTALEILAAGENAAQQGEDSPAQRRSRAVILALQRDRDSKLKAIELFKSNAEGRTPNEQFLLARLYAAVGNKKDFRLTMADLLKSDKNWIPLYTSFYAMWLIREDDLAEAEKWVKEIVAKDPNSLTTAEMKARLAAAKKDLAGAREAIVPRANDAKAPLPLIARLCEEIGLNDDAEQILTRFVNQNKEAQPQVVLILAGFYGRHQQTAKALQLCEDTRRKLPAAAMLAAEVAIRALYNDPSPAPGDMTKVSQWLEEGAAKPDPEARALALQLQASLRNLQNNGDYEGAEALYKQAIASNNRDVLAMNNLAFLLSAHKNQYAEALAWIEKAKAIIGPTNPTLLDTEALIRMKNGEFDKAYELMEIVIAEAPSKAAYFHLAQIQRERKKMTEARLAWQEALRRGLTRGDLHTLEHKAFDNFPNTLK